MHRVSSEARFDLDEIAFHLLKVAGPAIAGRIVSTITERFHLLSKHPFIGRARDDLGSGRRSFAVAPYVIVYSVENGDVSILRVIHGRRDLSDLLD